MSHDHETEVAEILSPAELMEKLGPLAGLVGTWEGQLGVDVAPSDDRGVEKNKFRERTVFTPIQPVDNHEQWLYGLRYFMEAWEEGEEKAFHEESGYWLWDPAEKQVMKCFTIPRGMTIHAGGTANADSKELKLSAVMGAPVYGISSNPFLDREFQTERMDLKVTIHDAHSFTYESDTQIRIKGQEKIFHHRDRNTLKRVPG